MDPVIYDFNETENFLVNSDGYYLGSRVSTDSTKLETMWDSKTGEVWEKGLSAIPLDYSNIGPKPKQLAEAQDLEFRVGQTIRVATTFPGQTHISSRFTHYVPGKWRQNKFSILFGYCHGIHASFDVSFYVSGSYPGIFINYKEWCTHMDCKPLTNYGTLHSKPVGNAISTEQVADIISTSVSWKLNSLITSHIFFYPECPTKNIYEG